MMTYEEARLYVEETPRYHGDMGLDAIRDLLLELGNPEKHLEFIHIAGTNGKGSVLSYLSTVLTGAGYRVGRYLSPTLYGYLERFQVNEAWMPEDTYVRIVETIRQAVDRVIARGGRKPSPFELDTVICFLYFKEQHCDYVVLECGCGGRDDATNVIPAPVLAVFASISLDHMAFLGDTVEKIADVKSGIIKPGCAVVAGVQQPGVTRVLKEAARTHGCSFYQPDPSFCEVISSDLEKQVIRYKNRNLVITLPGYAQVENVMLAFEACLALQDQGVALTESQIRNGLLKTRWQGRFSRICENPLFYVDGAHNPDAAEKLARSVKAYFADRRKIFIIGVLGDKDYQTVLKTMTPLGDEILAIETPDNDRALPADALRDAILPLNPHVRACDSLKTAVEEAFALSDENSVILSFGSLSFIGELTELVENVAQKN